jgi:hypothetical protein
LHRRRRIHTRKAQDARRKVEEPLMSNNKYLACAVALIAVLVGTDVACSIPAKTALDINALTACVETQLEGGATNVGAIAAACSTNEVALVGDLIGTLSKAQAAPTFAIRKAQAPAASAKPQK